MRRMGRMIGLVAGVIWLAGCAKEISPTPELRWLMRGWDSASTIVHDPVDRSTCQVKVIRAMAADGYFAVAQEKVEQITIWMKAEGYLGIADAYEAQKDKANRDVWMVKAANFIKTVEDWPRSQLTAEFITQANRYGDLELLRHIDTKIEQQPDDTFTIEIASIPQWRDQEGIQKAIEKLNELFPRHERIYGRKLQLLQAYLDLEDDALEAGRNDEATMIGHERDHFLESLPKADNLMLFLNVAERQAQRGKNDECIYYLGKAGTLMEDLAHGGFAKANLLRQLAGLNLKIGKRDEALALLEKAEEEVLNETRAEPFERSDCMLALADEWKHAEFPDRYNLLLSKEMDFIESNGNLRAMAVMTTGLCLEAAGQPEILDASLAVRADTLIERLRQLAAQRKFRTQAGSPMN